MSLPNKRVLKQTVFAAPGLMPDVLLEVFDEHFHVHSVLIKLHSHFFRKFLDSPEKSKDASAQFPYHYTTAIDDDGTWGLEPMSMAKPLTQEMLENFENSWAEKEAFRNLLCAIYNRPYSIDNYEQLAALVRIADFFCALPIVSNTIAQALLGTSVCTWMPHANTYDQFQFGDLLTLAKKVRNSHLFRECFVHAVAAFDPDARYKFIIEDKKIQDLIERQYDKIVHQITNIQGIILSALITGKLDLQLLSSCTAGFMNTPDGTWNRMYYSELQQKLAALQIQRDQPSYELKVEIDKLLVNNLPFSKVCQSPFGCHQFHCAVIRDEQMPWDPKETHW